MKLRELIVSCADIHTEPLRSTVLGILDRAIAREHGVELQVPTRETVGPPMTCPRRQEAPLPHYRDALFDDHWNLEPNGDCTCSYCGSIHPQDLMKIAREVDGVNTYFSMSDKGYKVYIHRPHVSNALEGAIKYYTHHNPDVGIIPGWYLVINSALRMSESKFEERLQLLTPLD